MMEGMAEGMELEAFTKCILIHTSVQSSDVSFIVQYWSQYMYGYKLPFLSLFKRIKSSNEHGYISDKITLRVKHEC